jgi:hypothetical protein
MSHATFFKKMAIGSSRRRLSMTAMRRIGIAFLAAFVFPGTQALRAAEPIVVYKSPTCGCCSKWVDHLKAAGFQVVTHERPNMAPIKERMGVPRNYQSCHTAQVEGYFIEGHVPVADIRQLLRERPDIRGLAVPGMPMGSPGMEGPRKDPYAVVSIGKDGSRAIFSEH